LFANTYFSLLPPIDDSHATTSDQWTSSLRLRCMNAGKRNGGSKDYVTNLYLHYDNKAFYLKKKFSTKIFG
jgi:hypothetical protein